MEAQTLENPFCLFPFWKSLLPLPPTPSSHHHWKGTIFHHMGRKKKNRTKNKDLKVSYKAKRAWAGWFWGLGVKVVRIQSTGGHSGRGSESAGQQQSRLLRRACCQQEWAFGVSMSHHCYNSWDHEKVTPHRQIYEGVIKMVVISIIISPLRPVFCSFMDNSHLFPHLRPALEQEVTSSPQRCQSSAPTQTCGQRNEQPWLPARSPILRGTHLASLHAD